MRPFCQFEVDFYVLNKAIHLNPAWIRADSEALPTLTLYLILASSVKFWSKR